jgi:hypothetical protein
VNDRCTAGAFFHDPQSLTLHPADFRRQAGVIGQLRPAIRDIAEPLETPPTRLGHRHIAIM